MIDEETEGTFIRVEQTPEVIESNDDVPIPMAQMCAGIIDDCKEKQPSSSGPV
jgi:uncharacterized radical SAM superfamily Fe-S cluster-containing enzyme